MNHCLEITKKYYSCFPLLYQVGILLTSYGSILKDDEKKAATIKDAKKILIRVKTMSGSIELKQLALQTEAICETIPGNSYKVIELLESEKRYCFHPSIGVLLSLSYQTIEKMQEAKITLQDSILESVISLIYDISSYLALCTDDIDYF